jgi:uncharacterized protein (DUF2345 family)
LPATLMVPPTKDPFNEMFVLKDKKGNPVANFPYQIQLENGRVVRGVTDEMGRTQRVGSGAASSGLSIKPDVQK